MYYRLKEPDFHYYTEVTYREYGKARLTLWFWTGISITSMLCLAAQSRPTLCDPMDCSPPGSSVHGILQARILEWAAMPSSRGSSQPRNQTHVSHITGDSLSHEGSPGILGWVAYPFSRETSWLKNWTGVSCIVGRFFYQLSYPGSPLFTYVYECIHWRVYVYIFIYNICVYTYIHTHTYTCFVSWEGIKATIVQ